MCNPFFVLVVRLEKRPFKPVVVMSRRNRRRAPIERRWRCRLLMENHSASLSPPYPRSTGARPQPLKVNEGVDPERRPSS